jgi:two-component system OmpR family response regulator
MNGVFTYISHLKTMLLNKVKILGDKNKYKILIVEDNKLYSLLLSQVFKECNELLVKCVYSGEECIENVSWNPDVIILDHYLPGIDGVQTIKEIRKRNINPNIIVISGQDDIKVAIEYVNLGITRYINKCHESKPIVKLISYVKSLKPETA